MFGCQLGISNINSLSRMHTCGTVLKPLGFSITAVSLPASQS